MNAREPLKPVSNMVATADATLAQRGRSFYWARYWLGATHAAHATRLYGFCRHLDDLADEAPLPALGRQALDDIHVAIGKRRAAGASANANANAHTRTSALVIDALSLMHECGIEPDVVLELIKGVRSDLEPVLMADETELLRYCYRVAGTVGLMMCKVLGASDGVAFRHAIDLGIAMQLTNICRDVAEDAAMGRRYLPSSLLGEVAPAALVAPAAQLQPRLRSTLAALLALAERYYRSGEQGLRYLPGNARRAVLIAAHLYREIGRQLARQHHACWERRTVVSFSAKLRVTGGALWQLASKPHRDACAVAHDATLHIALLGLPGTALTALASNAR